MGAVVCLEMQDPKARGARVDVVLAGRGRDGTDRVVILELKQWSEVDFGHEATEKVHANIYSGRHEDVPHPSEQALNYMHRLRDYVEECHEGLGAIDVKAYSLLYNLSPDDAVVLRDQRYSRFTSEAPIVDAGSVEFLMESLVNHVGQGEGIKVANRFQESKIRPSDRFIAEAANVIRGRTIYRLIAEQLNAFRTIIGAIEASHQSGGKHVFVVNGGPGTGKSAVALQLMAESFRKEIRDVEIVARAASFNRILKKELGRRLEPLVQFSDRYRDRGLNSIDVVIVDEAHRLESKTRFEYRPGRRQLTRAEIDANLSQVEEIVRSAKVTVFFTDELQIVKPQESGSIELMRQAAESQGATFRQFGLAVQHRALGSQTYLDWIDGLFNNRGLEPHTLSSDEPVHFEIVNDPSELISICSEWNKRNENSARIVAGWCWKWSQTTNEHGELIDEVIIPDGFSLPWEAPLTGRGGRLAKGIARGEFWASDPSAAGHVGSIYTAQNFDFDVICVLWPLDLQWDPIAERWTGHPQRGRESKKGGHPFYDNVDPNLGRLDSDTIIPYLKNVYRTLLTRGLNRVYVHFMHEPTKNRFIELVGQEYIQTHRSHSDPSVI